MNQQAARKPEAFNASTHASPQTLREGASATSVDVYTMPHRTLRYILVNLLVSMGRASFAELADVDAVLTELSAALWACDNHIEHEDRHLRPALEQRAASTVATLDSEHVEHAQQVEELRAIASSLRHAQTRDGRTELGRTLYLHFSVFVADTLAHMAYEERVVQPLLDRLFTTEELQAIHGAIMASIPPHEMMVWLRSMLPAADRETRAALAMQVRSMAPPEAFAALMSDLRNVLGPKDIADLERRIGLATSVIA